MQHKKCTSQAQYSSVQSTCSDSSLESAAAGACSLYGICLAVATAAANTAPTITLLTTTAAPVTTTIKLGYSYTACASGQQPSSGAECELGATAQDSQNGNLTSSVLVCAPAVCTAPSCISSKTFNILPQVTISKFQLV